MRGSLAFLAMLASSSAAADTITCMFTEPSVTTVYSMAQNTLTILDPVSDYPRTVSRVIGGVRFVIKGPGEFVLLGKDGNLIQAYSLNFKGDDGVSDKSYPFMVKWPMAKQFNNQIGGCASDLLKGKDPAENDKPG